jgi:hypothetical protein
VLTACDSELRRETSAQAERIIRIGAQALIMLERVERKADAPAALAPEPATTAALHLEARAGATQCEAG